MDKEELIKEILLLGGMHNHNIDKRNRLMYSARLLFDKYEAQLKANEEKPLEAEQRECDHYYTNIDGNILDCEFCGIAKIDKT